MSYAGSGYSTGGFAAGPIPTGVAPEPLPTPWVAGMTSVPGGERWLFETDAPIAVVVLQGFWGIHLV